jgi:uncharacterized protein YebE (UPF0316 family)
MIYLFIFILKILENSISTLRLIFVSNGNKTIGSILLFVTSIIWITTSGITIININIFSILVFAIGSAIGSYLGSILEEKLAFGLNLIICISSTNIVDKLRKKGYIVTKINGTGIDGYKDILLIVIKRKDIRNLINYINSINKDVLILKEFTSIIK